jgi:hypothetical protein
VVIIKKMLINKEIYPNSGPAFSPAMRGFFDKNLANRIESEKGNKLHKHKNNF